MLIEIHLLQNHAPSNLNRDDTGSPKECIFGGLKRARISSQCLKRSIRRSDLFQESMKGNLATRTRRLPELVRDRLLEAGLSKALVEVAAKKASTFGKKEKGSEKQEKGGVAIKKQKGSGAEGKEHEKLETAQTMFLTDADIVAVTEVLRAAAEKAGTPEKLEKVSAAELQKEAEQKGYRPVTVDIALFGRMITSEAFRNVEASVQVAHAISTHKVDHEYDYFTAVDDLMRTSAEEEDAGADMIGDVEFNSACYYKYFSIDLNGLINTLTGETLGHKGVSEEEKRAAESAAKDAVAAFLKASILTTPTGKQNTFAAHQLPAAVLVEIRPFRTPVSYANAFVDPARQGREGDLVSASLAKLASHVKGLTAGFNLEAKARLLLAPEHADFSIDGVERVQNLNALCERVQKVMADG